MGHLRGRHHPERAHPPALAAAGPHVGAPHEGGHADQGLHRTRRAAEGVERPRAPVEQRVDQLGGAVAAQHLGVDQRQGQQAAADQHRDETAPSQAVEPGAEAEHDEEAQRQRGPEGRVGEPREVQRRLEADHRGRADNGDQHRHEHLASRLRHRHGGDRDHHREDGRHHARQHGRPGAQDGFVGHHDRRPQGQRERAVDEGAAARARDQTGREGHRDGDGTALADVRRCAGCRAVGQGAQPAQRAAPPTRSPRSGGRAAGDPHAAVARRDGGARWSTRAGRVSGTVCGVRGGGWPGTGWCGARPRRPPARG